MLLHHQKPEFVLSFSALVLAIFIGHCSATKFIVGDSNGWVIPPYPYFYTNWSRSNFIRSGDTLEFKFDAKFYNLIQVTQFEYNHCTSMEPLKVFNTSPAIIELKEREVLYFTCSILNYCNLGQRIEIYVHDPPPPPPPSPPRVAPIISPTTQPHGNGSSMSKPPSPSRSTMPPKLAPGPIVNGGNSPVPASTHRGNSNDSVGLMFGISFNVFLGLVFSVFGACFLGFN